MMISDLVSVYKVRGLVVYFVLCVLFVCGLWFVRSLRKAVLDSV